MSNYKIVHLELKEANALVGTLHRHHNPVQGHRFSIGVEVNGILVGAAIVGRPVARMIDHKKVAEVTRLVTDGTKNACSLLYSASARACKELGYEKIQTYILSSETGTSLVAAGWICEGEAGGGSWVRKNRDRREDSPMEKKTRWSKILV